MTIYIKYFLQLCKTNIYVPLLLCNKNSNENQKILRIYQLNK